MPCRPATSRRSSRRSAGDRRLVPRGCLRLRAQGPAQIGFRPAAALTYHSPRGERPGGGRAVSRVQRVDGTRDRPPGKTAENWSRKDGIRAGAVSGPWRSCAAARRGRARRQAGRAGRRAGHAMPAPRSRAGTAAAAPAYAARRRRRWQRRRPSASRRAPQRAVRPAQGEQGLGWPPGSPSGWSSPPDASASPCSSSPRSPTPRDGAGARRAGGAGRCSGKRWKSPGAEPMRAATAAAGEAAAAPAPGPETLAGVTNVRLRTGTGFADAGGGRHRGVGARRGGPRRRAGRGVALQGRDLAGGWLFSARRSGGGGGPRGLHRPGARPCGTAGGARLRPASRGCRSREGSTSGSAAGLQRQSAKAVRITRSPSPRQPPAAIAGPPSRVRAMRRR